MADLKKTFRNLQEGMKKGKFDSFLPMLPFIRLDGHPMNLDNHYPLEPFFRLKLPRRLVFKCGRQVGKCFVSSSSLISKDNGYPQKANDLTKNTSLITKDKALRVDYNPVINIFDNGVKPAIRVTTRRGSVLEVTPNHRLYTLSGYKEAGDLTTSDFVMYPSKAGKFMGKKYPENRIKVTAYLLGDGSIQANNISFTNENEDCLSEYIDCVEGDCNIQTKKGTKIKSVQLRKSSVVYAWMKEDALLNTYSDTKFIPEWVFDLTKAQTALFVSRLWATDGSIKTYHGFPSITYCSVSKDLIYQLRALLTKFGISSTIRHKKAGYVNPLGEKVVCKDAYELRVEGRKSQYIFLNTFSVPGKPSVRIPAVTSNNNRDVVPIDVRDIIKELFAGVKDTKNGNSLRASGLRSQLKYNISYPKLHRFIKLADSHSLQDTPAYAELVAIYNSDFRWDRIVGVEDIGMRDTMDLEIDANHNYILNGIVSHNSISLASRGLLDSCALSNFHTLFVQPRYDQVKRFSSNYMAPLVADSIIGRAMVDPSREQSILQKSFKNGSNMYFSYAFLDADRCRGFAVAKCVFDESLSWDSDVQIIENGVFTTKKLFLIKKGDLLASVGDRGCIITSVAEEDASFHGVRDVYEITMEDGTSIECTQETFIRTDRGWMTLNDIAEDMYDITAIEQQLVSEQVPDITKIYYKTTRERSELGLQRLLNLAEHEGTTSLLVGVYPQISTKQTPDGKEKIRYERIVSIKHKGKKEVFDISVAGTKNFFANGCNVHNCQDIQYDFIPIIGETMSAQTKYGFYQFSGTPKTVDNTLSVLFSKSSQAEWIIRCGCGKYNIPNLDNDILGMIGTDGPVCAECSRPLDVSTGEYVHAERTNINSFRGYHISQVTHPLHACYPMKWKELLYKKETYSEAKFYNEILGEPCDEAVKPLTEGDIRKASNGYKNDLRFAVGQRKKYDSIIMGVDWSGYGSENISTTVVTIVGVIPGSDIIHCIYLERFKTMPPEEEAKKLVDYAMRFKITYLAHDFSGAGMIREATLIQRGFPPEQVIPFQIVHAPIAQSIINYYDPANGGRTCYNIDKTRSLMVLYEMIKKQKVTLPDWEKNDGETKDVLRDLLNIAQETRETPRGGEFTLMVKSPGKTDDFAHALNLACAAVWHLRGRYPSLVVDTPSEEVMRLMDPYTANWN